MSGDAKINYLDLFSGIGGFALGAYWAGLRFDAHYFSEVDDYAIRVYKQRFPDAIGLGDIRAIRSADLPQGDWIISGGFPCQDISVAGKGAGLAGARSGLWFEYARVIGELRPRYAIMENVGALAFRGLDAVLGSLAEIGYDAEWQDIRASDVGAPHRRERLWIVAYPSGHEWGDRRAAGNMDGKERQESKGRDQSSQAAWDSGKNGDAPDPMRDGRDEWRAEREGFCGRASPIGTSNNIPDTDSGRREQCNPQERSVPELDSNSATIPDAASSRRDRCAGEEQHVQRSSPQAPRPCNGNNVADANSSLRDRRANIEGREAEERAITCGGGKTLADTANGGNVRRDRELGTAQNKVRQPGRSAEDGRWEWWQLEPAVCGMVDGLPAELDGYHGRTVAKMADRVNRLKCLGNSIVPQIAQLIFEQEAFDEWRTA